VTDETGAAAGWYADPTGRYEHRYYNGRAWTADVSAGGQRFVDQLGLEPTVNPSTDTPDGARNGMGTAAMVLGIVAISTSWMPFAVVLGVIAGVLALVFGWIGLRRAENSGTGRSFAIVGLATGASALAAATVGVVLTMVVLHAYDDYLNPQPNAVVVTECELQGSRATMTGVLTNTGEHTADYSVLVGFVRTGTDNAHRSKRVNIDDVAPGADATFTAQAQIDLEAIDCVILDVNGPLPFGVTVD
jgi:Protein of unknown function (DUF2510)